MSIKSYYNSFPTKQSQEDIIAASSFKLKPTKEKKNKQPIPQQHKNTQENKTGTGSSPLNTEVLCLPIKCI